MGDGHGEYEFSARAKRVATLPEPFQPPVKPVESVSFTQNCVTPVPTIHETFPHDLPRHRLRHAKHQDHRARRRDRRGSSPPPRKATTSCPACRPATWSRIPPPGSRPWTTPSSRCSETRRRAAARSAASAISGQQHGFVPLDRERKVIRPAKLWCDTSTAEECDLIRAPFRRREGA